MAEPRTKSGRVVKPSWRLQQNESYVYPAEHLEPSPARSTSSLPGRSTESRPPPLKRKRTSLGTSSKLPAASPFDSSTELTPVDSATSSSTSILGVARRPPGHQPAFLTSAAFSSKPQQAAVSVRPALPPPQPAPKPAASRPPPPSRPKSAPAPRAGKRPTIRSFVDFSDGSEELGLIITSGEFAWDGEMDGGSSRSLTYSPPAATEADSSTLAMFLGGWRATKNVGPGSSSKYRVTMSVQKLPPGPGRSPSKANRRLSSPSQSKAMSSTTRRVPSPQEILARLPAGSKGKQRAASSVSGLDTDIGKGHTQDGIGITDDEYDARPEQQAASSSSSSSAPDEDPSDDEGFPSEPEEDNEDAFPASRRKGKRRKAAKTTTTARKKSPAKKRKTRAPEQARSPSFYGHGDSDAGLIDNGWPRDRFGMPFLLEDDDHDGEEEERHPPFSGGLNLSQFENFLPPDEQYLPEQQYHEQPAEKIDMLPPAPASDDGQERAMLELLAKVVQNGALAASALEARGAVEAAVEAVAVPTEQEENEEEQHSAEPVALGPMPREILAYVTGEDEPQDHEVLEAIIAAERLSAVSFEKSLSQPLENNVLVISDAAAEMLSEEEVLIMGSSDPLQPEETKAEDVATATDERPQKTSVADS